VSRPGKATLLPVVLVAAALAPTAACSSGGPGKAGPSGRLVAVATINAWGSVLSQLGGARVHETSIITNPSTDPHDYEPTPADARTIATAQVFVENGIGYDPWASKVLGAAPSASRVVVDVGAVVGVKPGGNPHRWYSPTDVAAVADAITAGLKRVDPGDAQYFETQHRQFLTASLARYHRILDELRRTYAGTPVGATESIVAPLCEALQLQLLTPPTFLTAISQGVDPSASDKATVDAQIRDRRIKVLLFNTQNATPDVSAQVAAARARGIPVVAVTETLSPPGASFQDWQVAQLERLRAALQRATGPR
jgi:zinc/manganese transport system substrate-binding protein